MRILELEGLQESLERGVCYNVCTAPSLYIVFKEDFSFLQGLHTSPYCFVRIARGEP